MTHKVPCNFNSRLGNTCCSKKFKQKLSRKNNLKKPTLQISRKADMTGKMTSFPFHRITKRELQNQDIKLFNECTGSTVLKPN